MTDKDGDVTELNLQLNSDGYVKCCKSIDHAGTPDADEFTWEMEYDTEAFNWNETFRKRWWVNEDYL